MGAGTHHFNNQTVNASMPASGKVSARGPRLNTCDSVKVQESPINATVGTYHCRSSSEVNRRTAVSAGKEFQ